MMLFRTFAIFAAALLVAAFGLAMLTPDGMTLDEGLAAMGPHAIGSFRHGVQHVLGAGAWTHLCMPLLVRPVWLIPLCLGMICAGVAASVSTPGESQHSTRTRP